MTDGPAASAAADPPTVVALVCSASGLAALTAVLSRLPASFPAAVVVIPPRRHALVTVDNQIALITSNGPPLYRPSADLLLTGWVWS